MTIGSASVVERQGAGPVSLLCIGRFHHFHLARQLEKHALLRGIWTGYPRFQLKRESGIPTSKIHSFPWLQAPYMAAGRFGITLPPSADRQLQWLARETLDRHASKQIPEGGTLIALSGGGLISGSRIKRTGGIYICDRGSTHIRFQERILREEYCRWKITFPGIDPRIIAREEAEYAIADAISVPSQFVARTFVEMGVSPHKLFINPYGASITRFAPSGPGPDPATFTVLFVGQVSLRKGFLYLLEAFSRLVRSGKRLKVVGAVAPELRPLLEAYNLDAVDFLGQVPNEQLAQIYSAAHVMVLPSVEEGLAMVIGEAMACGCPVIASENTGAQDFFEDGDGGFIVPARSVNCLVQEMQKLCNSNDLRVAMSSAALNQVTALKGWDTFGNRWQQFLKQMAINRA